MIVLSGADLVLPDRILSPGTLSIDGERIADVRAGFAPGGTLHHHYIVPGFVDVHVHGVEGFDTLDDSSPVAEMAARLPRYGVTGFCPTTIACAPDRLRRVLTEVHLARATRATNAARVLAAHLESNFINADFRGAQPLACLRNPRAALAATPSSTGQDEFSAADVLVEIERAGPDIGIVTLAPELEGGLDLVRWMTSHGHRVSLGHSGATFDQGLEAIAAGACHATHLFNRMPPLQHRAPGLAGAGLERDEVAAEIICDGYHVHPSVVRMAIAAKGRSRIMAITDGTAVSGLPTGSRATLGGQTITAGEAAAFLNDGTLAGSALTMDRAFRQLVQQMKLPIVEAAALCSTTPAHEVGLADSGVLATGAIADLVVLDSNLLVTRTYIAGRLVYSREGTA
jgi:N-acetylglucosamine-6-phosphate deacetylase